ncbi:mitochondrial import receptor subunit TOM7 homolog [Chrysoperla carnea]|uniref:mitochondrial import receptor subunit TOM7 homolog n=1 Tax=Chrysoperla carnea TaxID=189513 RepID=UPI001D0699BF|nr:mitochondrial import receptor subunit TOM7 homolog [Chrysoperla carnea]
MEIRMAEPADEVKNRFGIVVDAVKTAFHWGFIPGVIYLGFKMGPDPGMPPFSLSSLLWQ